MSLSDRTLRRYRLGFSLALMVALPITLLLPETAGFLEKPAQHMERYPSTWWTRWKYEFEAMVPAISFLTSVVSLVGLLVTTVISWRKDRRETASTRVELEKKKLELEMLRHDLSRKQSEKLRDGSDPPLE
ncbi:hypothetical protein ACIQUS_26695 [Pseudomonas sp. NPDC090755]|uniref:hypothetical protein n=1 Tax=Pseudomonas sp. NPDC090755 TaxID=3364481 RepID=UPI00383A8EE1